ncbi:5'/3'-nucleotidase SurE [Aureispira anguillae]|uniref:5'-nucleotidase SurE n=1 Tax=Aureispira anguillae TaxID=2864201 RepID=A0A915YAZ1_9BACT|nr:5'/3'-nucleotidase SurE [Aureispira anguillae]BDS09720.1 5'/3'-nucleotidase SurE [Aureispira anguillae]
MQKKPTILICNDDGITALGIRNLVAVAREFGNIVVVAPDSPQSAQGHSITIEDPIRIHSSDIFGSEVQAYECSGTPVDCIKIAKNVILKDQTIDLCLSGINHGSNASTNVIYSGTMSAAMEASMEGIPSIGFSLLDFDPNADFTASKHFVRKIVANALEKGLGDTLLLNVNIPKLPIEEINGIRICRQAKGYWAEDFQKGTDPIGRPYYWLTGKYIYQDEGEDSDIWALENGYVSVVPVMHDLTHHTAIDSLQHFE